jgi:hypothetical protein
MQQKGFDNAIESLSIPNEAASLPRRMSLRSEPVELENFKDDIGDSSS